MGGGYYFLVSYDSLKDGVGVVLLPTLLDLFSLFLTEFVFLGVAWHRITIFVTVVRAHLC